MNSFRIPFDFVNADASEMLDIVAEATNKRTFAASAQLVAYWEQKSYRSGKTSVKMINDEAIGYWTTFILNSFHPFFEEFQDVIHRTIATGAFILKRPASYRMHDDEVPALVLSMDDLSIGFMICLIPLSLSVFAFVAEFTMPKVKLLGKKLRDSIIAAFVVTTFAGLQTN